MIGHAPRRPRTPGARAVHCHWSIARRERNGTSDFTSGPRANRRLRTGARPKCYADLDDAENIFPWSRIPTSEVAERDAARRERDLAVKQRDAALESAGGPEVRLVV